MSERPTVTISYAQSLDGCIALSDGQSRWISGSETLTLAHQLRRDNDAILVGINTVLRDDPELSCRLPECDSPLRVVLDSQLRLPRSSTIVRTAGTYRTLVFAADDLNGHVNETRTALETHAIEVCHVRHTEHGLDIHHILEELAQRGVRSLFVEGGSGVITSFLREGCVDKIVTVTAPLVIGGGIHAVGSLGTTSLEHARRFKPVRCEQMGDDLVWELEAHE